ncbi:rRNA-processing protein EBP2, partial [Phenoliferia sp. Uapishka_3]
MSSSRQILKKATKVANRPTQSKSKAPAGKPLKDESSDEESDDGFQTDDQSESDDESGTEGDDDDEDEDSEEDDITPEALAKLRELLADVDPAELALLEEAMEGEDDDEEESGSEGEDGDEQDETMEAGSEDDEIEFEDHEEEDGDIIPVERTTVNDKVALERVLASFKTNTTFFDTLTLTYPKELEIPDAENDLERELEFYKQSLWAAQHAEGLFEAASLPFTRPNDYFAEMLKTDAHMSLIRQKLLDESAGIKASEDARKLRDAKKFGKKVQVERLKEREKDKKDVGKRLESLKKKRKNGDGGFATTEDFDIALEDAISGNPAKKRKVVESERGGRGGRGGSRGISRRGRDSKFGNPTTSRRPKENNDKLDGDGSGSSRGRGGGRGGRGGARGGRGGDRGSKRGGAGAQRLGKSRRK